MSDIGELFKWSIRLSPLSVEGQQGYLHRLLSANGLRWDHIKEYVRQKGNQTDRLDFACLQYATFSPKSSVVNHSVTDYRRVVRFARFCPRCLVRDACWRAEWEILFFDVCPLHAVNLIDCCQQCNKPITWRRRKLTVCDCGASFCEFSTTLASAASLDLAKALFHKLHRLETSNSFGLTDGLTLRQLQQIIQFFGAYGAFSRLPKPQKIRNLDQLAISWQLTSIGAEVMSQWPTGLHKLLDDLQFAQDDDWHINHRFGHFYQSLYRQLAEPVFQPIREEFEKYIGMHWKSPLALRNRRLTQEVIERSPWLSIKAAAKKLNLSPQDLQTVARLNDVEVFTRFGASGRRLMTVRREDLHRLEQEKDLLALEQSRNLIGLTKKRARSLIPLLCSDFIPPSGVSSKWRIPRSQLSPWLDIDDALARLNVVTENALSIKEILRYWHWPDQKLANFLMAVIKGEIKPLGKYKQGHGIASWVFEREPIRNWFQSPAPPGVLTVPEFAVAVGVKQEVAYFWVRHEFVIAKCTGSAGAAFISQADLEKFNALYVLARELAAKVSVSSKVLRQTLERKSIFPVSGPGVDGGRQLLYRRSQALEVEAELLPREYSAESH